EVSCFIDVSDTSLINSLCKSFEGSLGGLLIGWLVCLLIGPDKNGDSLPLRKSRIPGGFKRRPVLPIEMMIPYPQANRILLQVVYQPVGDAEKLTAPFRVSSATKQIVIAKAVLGDSDRIVLEPYGAMIVEQRNTCGIIFTGVIGFCGKSHVVFTQLSSM